MSLDSVDTPRRRHEPTDFSPSYIAVSGIILTVVAIGLYVLVWGFFNYFSKPPGPTQRATDLERSISAPRLQVDPHTDLERIRKREIEILSSYDWINKQDGIVRIPIDRAMDLVANRGLPEFSGTESPDKASK